MKIVMLGKLRSGKSTVSQLIQKLVSEQFNLTLISKPLAAPIYKEAKEFYAKHGLVWRKNRRLLEGIGEALNDDYPNGDKIVELYKETFNPNENIIIEDCRRKTQADFLSEQGAIFVRVNASDEVRKSRCAQGEWAEGHVTDMELDDYPADIIINNNYCNLDLLNCEIREQFEKYLERAARLSAEHAISPHKNKLLG